MLACSGRLRFPGTFHPAWPALAMRQIDFRLIEKDPGLPL